ncbi:MAG TPA: ATP-binding protein [Ktedonobacteraceae bacterium]|nr:ATP-binding protein [Ktedonobacteraceae bacterium]
MMNAKYTAQLEYILGNISVGIAIIDSVTLRVLYVNPYLHALLYAPWCDQDVTNRHLADIIPAQMYQMALPLLQQVSATGRPVRLAEVPYGGFLETRGRTYWDVRVACAEDIETSEQDRPPLLVTVEDITEQVRSRLHINAIHHISSTLADTSALPLVLARILQALQDMVGSRRCAVFLVDQPEETHLALDDRDTTHLTTYASSTASIATQKNVHPDWQHWQLTINEQTLLGRVIQERRTLIYPDTTSIPNIQLPYLDRHGEAVRPGSVLCVPIFHPYASARDRADKQQADGILGTIEVYHRRARGFPAEEIRLLERFAQQAGLAIENARLVRSIESWARVASRNARQKENIMQAIPDGVVLYDLDWHIIDVNYAARKLFGWSDDIIGRSIVEAMNDSSAQVQHLDFLHLPNPTAELEHRALTRQIDEFKLTGADDKRYTLRCTYTPIRDNQNDIFAFVVVYHDNTRETANRERIEAEVVARTAELAQRNDALQRANEAQELMRARMEILLERLPSGVLHVDAHDLKLSLINSRAVQLLHKIGLTFEPSDNPDLAARRAIGQPIEALFHDITLYDSSGEPMPYEERPFARALYQGETSDAELSTPETNGQVYYFLCNAAPLRAADGTISSVIIVLHEITRTKTLERTREEFFTTMAHELKTPLANVRAHLSAPLAQDLTWTMEEQMNFLRTADEQVERLVGMINQFLDASRVEAQALRLEREAILLPELFEDLQERLEALITSSEHQLKVAFTPETPAVFGDYELVISVLINLLSNAFRYAPAGDFVLLEAELVADGVTIRVTDRGPGLTQEQQETLFTRFSTFAASRRPQVDRPGQATSEKRRGSERWSPTTGLGLYISRGIIEAHGSTLIVNSTPGHGATFAFTLPIFTGKGKQEQ